VKRPGFDALLSLCVPAAWPGRSYAAGPTGLLPEEYDPITERSLGNHPQAYSHLGLIRCAMLLDAMS
jgi:hypothetical protein